MTDNSEYIKKSKKIYIYGLIDPRDELVIENVRYVGKTNNIHRRLLKHVQDSRNKGTAPTHKWISKLNYQRPQHIILEECNENTWQKAERKYIKLLRKSNRLLNILKGVVIRVNQ